MRQHQESPLRPSHQPNGQVLAAEGSGNVEPPDLPDGLFADDEASEAIVLNDDEENEPIKCKPSGDEDCQEPRVLRDPGAPSQKDIDEHEAGGHATYRRWCEACVEGRGVGEPLMRPRSRSRRYRSWLSITCLLPQEMRSRLVVKPPLWRWRSIR